MFFSLITIFKRNKNLQNSILTSRPFSQIHLACIIHLYEYDMAQGRKDFILCGSSTKNRKNRKKSIKFEIFLGNKDFIQYIL